jgi:hypothetical protein
VEKVLECSGHGLENANLDLPVRLKKTMKNLSLAMRYPDKNRNRLRDSGIKGKEKKIA